ncbi:MAG: hypothetical protein AB2989_04855 [Candidatus Symbiodolus clandestinus]
MSRIQGETTKINDYYSTMPEPILEEPALDPLAARSTKDHPLSQQMSGILQDFTMAMHEPDVSKRSAQFQGSMVQVERFQAEVRQLAAQPGMDMGSIMLEVNQLLSKMRDVQRDNAIQQQQNALNRQEMAYDHAQKSISSNKSASMIKGIWGAVGGGVGLAGGLGKMGSAFAESKLKGNADKITNALSEAEAKTKAKTEKMRNAGVIVEALGTAATPITATAGELHSMGASTEAQQLNRQSDREKEYQKLNETQYDRKEADARDSSQQMRSIQQQMADLYGKIVSAVRW